MKKLTTDERQNQIIELLTQNGAMKIVDLANYFKVSRETIRRDLITLTERGEVKKWYGGVISNRNLARSPSVYRDIQQWMGNSTQLERLNSQIRLLEEKMQLNADIKMKIAQKALELIPPQSSIFLDNGSTPLFLARLLNQQSGYTIITSSVQVVNTCINSSNSLLICGGAVNPRTLSATGPSAVDFLRKLKTNAAIMGSEGFLSNGGPTGNDLNYSQVKRAALENTDLRIVLADSSKAEYSALARYASWKDIDYLITDSRLNSELKSKISADTKIIFADI